MYLANLMLWTPLLTSFLAVAATASPSALRRRLEDTAAAKACNGDFPPLNFTIVDGDAVAAAIEDDIRQNLAAIGIPINTIVVNKDDFNDLQTSGMFHLSFSESHGCKR